MGLLDNRAGGGGGTGVGIRVCFAGLFGVCFGGMFGIFRGYFTRNFGGMFWGMSRGYVSGYVWRVGSPCALLKPGPRKNERTHMFKHDNAKGNLGWPLKPLEK